VIERLRPVIIELERMRIDVLVVSHQVVMKTLLCYFAGLSLHDLHRIQVPLHTLYRLEPKPYGSELTRCTYVSRSLL
jgi:6-phosphofructo-2-kinase